MGLSWRQAERSGARPTGACEGYVTLALRLTRCACLLGLLGRFFGFGHHLNSLLGGSAPRSKFSHINGVGVGCARTRMKAQAQRSAGLTAKLVCFESFFRSSFGYIYRETDSLEPCMHAWHGIGIVRSYLMMSDASHGWAVVRGPRSNCHSEWVFGTRYRTG